MDFLAGEFAKRTLAEWDAYLRTLDVCYGRVNTLPEALEHENLRAGGALPQDELGRTHIGPPIRFLAEPARPVLREPTLGEHTAQVLGELAVVSGS
jgi:crotonobetainyl-CoA:carnitine CoA-transferase CaiB-like acyl-CoA transferase